MNKKINILFISRTSKLGGAEKTLLELVRNLKKELYEPNIALPDSKGLFFKELKEANIQTYLISMPFLRITYNIFLWIWFIIKLIVINFKFLLLLKRKKYKIIVCNSFQDSIFIALPAKLLRRKLVIYVKNILNKRWKKYLRAWFCSTFADLIIAVSKRAAEDIRVLRSVGKKIKVVYDGINFNEFNSYINLGDVYKDYPFIKKESFKIINIGNLSNLKGQHFLIESLSLKKIRDLDIQVLFLGDINYQKDVSYKKRLKKMVSEKGIENKVFFLGYHEDIKKFIDISHVLVHCPVEDDCFPRVILEALSMKKLVIATKVGGIPEVIEDSKNGFLSKKNKKDLAEKILFVYNNEKKLDMIKNNGLNIIKEKFSLEKQIIETERIFHQILEKK